MSEYRMVAGMVVFIIIVMATLGSASTEYPETIPTGPSGTWPPSVPQFGRWDPTGNRTYSCTDIVSCTAMIAFGIIEVVAFLINVAIYVSEIIILIVNLFVGIFHFAIHGLPSEIAFVGTAIAVAFLFVVSLLIFRIIMGAIPFSGGF